LLDVIRSHHKAKMSVAVVLVLFTISGLIGKTEPEATFVNVTVVPFKTTAKSPPEPIYNALVGLVRFVESAGVTLAAFNAGSINLLIY